MLFRSDRGRRIGAATAAIGDDESGFTIGDDEGCDSNGNRGRRRVRFEQRSVQRRSRTALGSGFVLFLGLDRSLSLSLRLFASCVLLHFG